MIIFNFQFLLFQLRHSSYHIKRTNTISNQNKLPTLFVDLDGTLFKTDTLLELIISILKKSPLIIFKFPFWLYSGKAYFKKRVSNHVEVNF